MANFLLISVNDFLILNCLFDLTVYFGSNQGCLKNLSNIEFNEDMNNSGELVLNGSRTIL